MKLELRGHHEVYVVEQTLMTLLPPGEPMEYGEVDPASDRRWAIITLEDRADGGDARCCVRTELGWDGRTGPYSYGTPLSGTEYEREGQRRRAVTLSIFLAVRTVLAITPPWGGLTGVRPGKLVTAELAKGQSVSAIRELLEKIYYVTPARADLVLETGAVTWRTAGELGPRDVALYAGIPFCPTRCAYCSFVSSSVERSFALVDPYVDALTAEIAAGGAVARELGLRVRAFYLGGGTPTTLSSAQMDRVLAAVESSFDLSACEERTVEAGRPDTVTAEKLAGLKARGVTRVSVNPQTMEDHVLRAIGRRHSADDIRRAMELVHRAGFAHVNMDLIAGLPEDGPEGFRRSLDECLGMGADNVTVHTLALKKGSKITLEHLRIPGPEAVGEMLDYADPALRAAGYTPYYLYRQKYMSGGFENVGWCRPGAENLYNICMMEEICSILSFGAGGSTKVVAPDGNISRCFNLKYPKEYIERPEKWRANQAAFAAGYRPRESSPPGGRKYGSSRRNDDE